MFIISETKSRREIDNLLSQDIQPEKNITQSSTSTFRDVHVYDNKVEEIVLPSYDQELKISTTNHLKTLLKRNEAIQMLNIINSRNNIDPANKVDSHDLLVWICTHKITPELFLLLEEQLADNFCLGTCLQGSSHRIRQIFYAQSDIQ